MRSLLLVSLLIVLLLPILYGAAQPDNMTRELDPELMELKKKIDEKINMTELEKFWEEMKNVPGPSLTPEPNVYVPGRGYVTDGQGGPSHLWGLMRGIATTTYMVIVFTSMLATPLYSVM